MILSGLFHELVLSLPAGGGFGPPTITPAYAVFHRALLDRVGFGAERLSIRRILAGMGGGVG